MRPGWERVASSEAPAYWRHARTGWTIVTIPRKGRRPMLYAPCPPRGERPIAKGWRPKLLAAMVVVEDEIAKRSERR